MSALIGSIIVFLLVVLLHEFGHFSVAKWVQKYFKKQREKQNIL